MDTLISLISFHSFLKKLTKLSFSKIHSFISKEEKSNSNGV